MFVATARMLMLERLVSANDSCAFAAVALLQTHKPLFKLLSFKNPFSYLTRFRYVEQ